MSSTQDALIGSAVEIGQTVYAHGNLEDSGDASRFSRCDGRNKLRTAVSSTYLTRANPTGVMTYTARTLAFTPAAHSITADATNFLALAGADTACVQSSVDGVTWGAVGGWNVATTPICVKKCGSRFVLVGSGPDLTTPQVSAINQASPTPKSAWTATTIGTTAGTTNCIAYSATRARTVYVRNTAGTGYIYTLDDGATAWVARSSATSLSKLQVVWDGAYFWATTSTGTTILRSTDGITWTELTMPYSYYVAYPDVYGIIASDGAGTVALIASDEKAAGVSALLVTKDYGATWGVVNVILPATASITIVSIDYANNIFIVSKTSTSNNVQLSRDALTWHYPGNRTLVSSYGFAYKAGVYCGITVSTAAQSFVPDDTMFVLPMQERITASAIGVNDMLGYQFVRVR